MLVARRFSITNFVIASSALAFQVFVLYPWHEKLDRDFAKLQQENTTLLRALQENGLRIRAANPKDNPATTSGAIAVAR